MRRPDWKFCLHAFGIIIGVAVIVPLTFAICSR